MSTLFTGPEYQAFDGNGNPLSGGTVEFYEVGTSTPKDVYSDSSLSTSLGSTVTLDSEGRAKLWLNGNYKAVLKKSDGTTVRTSDGINPPIDTETTGGNLIANGSFETQGNASTEASGWTLTAQSDGSVERITSDNFDGEAALKFTSDGSGGGQADTNSFFAVSPGRTYEISFALKCSVADIRNIVQVRYFDKDQQFLSSTSVYDEDTSNPTSWTVKTFTDDPPASARFAKLRILGADQSDSTAGEAKFDAVRVGQSTINARFPNVDSDVTASDEELNKLDGFTGGTADLNRTATTEQWVHIETKSPSGVSSVDFTDLDSTYDKYKIVVRGLETSDGKELLARYSSDNGSSFDSGSTDYGWAILIGSLADLDSDSDSKMQLTDAVASSFNRHGEIILEFMGDGNASNSLGQPRLVSDLTSGKLRFLASGKRKSNVTADAVRLLVGTGTLTGTFLVYGWRDGS